MFAEPASVPGATPVGMTQGEPNLDAVSVLADEYALRILLTIEDQPRTAAEIVRVANLPPAACYRRLRTLVAAGLATQEGSVPSKNGKPAQQYLAAVSRFRVVFEDGQLLVNFDLRAGGTRELVLRLPIENP